ncbi:MAG: sugar phosphate isomerase/epimerase [Lachnospiraceae bacterium]|nr:sugar phosphate isomerase/epimerase [Lachnospiraceae bacterium]MDE6183884.1 sugar phosphate isomerase/epimerase [Lachnospiraceae bacterium]
MAITRGVSLYSLQEDYYLGKLDLEGCIAKTANEIDAKGIEVLPDQMPLPSLRSVDRVLSQKDLDTWFGWMEKYGTFPAAYDANFFTTMFSNRHMSVKETIEWTRKDLYVAHQMGFPVYRTGIIRHEDIEILSACFDYAEELGVQIATEVHAPRGIHTWWTQDFLEEIQRKNTKSAGFVVDFGIFTVGMSLSSKHKYERAGAKTEILEAIDEAYRAGCPLEDSDIEKLGGGSVEKEAAERLKGSIHDDPAWLREVLPYTKHCHGKFYEMTEECKEPSIDYAGPIQVMQEIGWEGCISSEYEGQRDYFDIGCDIYMDPVEQCRRHHMMLKRLLGEA